MAKNNSEQLNLFFNHDEDDSILSKSSSIIERIRERASIFDRYGAELEIISLTVSEWKEWVDFFGGCPPKGLYTASGLVIVIRSGSMHSVLSVTDSEVQSLINLYHRKNGSF